VPALPPLTHAIPRRQACPPCRAPRPPRHDAT
jgi:hypothetical protein